MPLWSSPRPSSFFRAKHSLRSLAAHHRLADGAARKFRARGGQRGNFTVAHVRSAANHPVGIATVRDRAYAEMVRIGMRLDRIDPDGDDILEIRVAVPQALDFETRHGKTVRNPLGRQGTVHIIEKPVETNEHRSSHKSESGCWMLDAGCKMPAGWRRRSNIDPPLSNIDHLTSNIRSSELVQETEVVLEEKAKVVYAEFQHGNPLDPHSEGEPRHLLRVIADIFEDLGVDHSGPEYLEPPRLRAHAAALPAAHDALDVHLGARFG